MQLVHKNTQNTGNEVLLRCNSSIPQIMKYLHNIKFIAFAFIILLSITSCSKEELGRDRDFAGITVSLRSSAGNLDKVFIDIEDVQVKVKEDGSLPSSWISLNTINTGTHNVSDLRGNSELLLVDHFEIRPTYIYEIRLVLGNNNFMDVNETLINLDVTENGNATPANLVSSQFEGNHIYQLIINLDIDESISFNEDEDMTILNPKLYTEIRKF